eukprot:TRINITY_DN35846_c0_g1_i3.p4 TRINITY_DN35846_c0_g1~~TRINITY_DN35846_c0_g1_i3.p4  ORF type:complete len:188 (+),score=50.90 TRINITY_DN35846_c0_g1_i3:73-636(+)
MRRYATAALCTRPCAAAVPGRAARAASLRPPVPEDAAAISALAARCRLSAVAPAGHLLYCTHWAEYSCAAEAPGGDLHGFAEAHPVPGRGCAVAYVAQLAVAPAARRRGLALRMLLHCAAAGEAGGVEASVAAENAEMRRVFDRLARCLACPLCISDLYSAGDLVCVGPIAPGAARSALERHGAPDA